MEAPKESDLPLPPEIVTLICSSLSKPDLLRLRLTCHKLNDVATPFAFGAFYLRAYGDSPKNFTAIAKSVHLRGYVREITVDTNVGPGFEYESYNTYPFPHGFFNALPYLRCFTKATRLHLRFNEYSGSEETEFGDDVVEKWPFRYRILDTVFHCVTGLWTNSRQVEIDSTASLEAFEPEYSDNESDFVPGYVIQLEELTISNLGEYNDPDLASSIAWHKLLSLPSLKDLKLLITMEKAWTRDNYMLYTEKYEFFQTLPSNWLSPSLTDNLRDLSLYYADYWGWFPRMNLYDLSSLPQLKVLALGNFVFSDERQTDWIATVGHNNGSGGLEELYLDDCSILFEATQVVPLTGDKYPVSETFIRAMERDNFDGDITFYSMRWHHVLSTWREKMKGLKTFIMSHSDWEAIHEWQYACRKRTCTAIMRQEECSHLTEDELNQRACHNTHRLFNAPAKDRILQLYEPESADKYIDGAGMLLRRATQMQYIRYELGLEGTPWEVCRTLRHGEPDEAFAPEDETIEKDDAAYELLMATIQNRNSGKGMV
ncbi:f-box protein [Fusarium austroafricanum]|uniref:F-box protein n=1 Tax=Fusarium austroafricanum TaxID=2364996 RepID=A0A8H4JK78_9HYPO|nr:f-box protein [Fusarium austroafricanum]